MIPNKKSQTQEVCEPLWDGASCVPATSVGEHAIFPCMTMYDHKFYDTACTIKPLTFFMLYLCPIWASQITFLLID